MKSAQGILLAILAGALAANGFAQEPAATTTQPAVRPAVAFPPTPTPAPKEAPMDAAALDAHLVPTDFLNRTSDVLGLVYNGFRRSQVDPCGCVSHQLGGLAKEATLVKRLEELKIPILELDAGGFVRDMPDQKMITQSEYLLKGLGKLGYDAVNVGFTDLAIAPDELKKVAKEANVDLVSANIQDASGNLVFSPYVVKTVKLHDGKDMRVGIIGVTRPRVELQGEAANQPSQVTSTSGSGSSVTLTITNPTEAAAKYLDEIKDKADFVVVMDYDRRSNAEVILKGIADKQIADVLIMGENAQIQGNVQTSSGTQVVSGGYEGRQMGTLYVELKDNNVQNTWNRHIEVVQTIPSDPEIEKLVEETHDATKADTPGVTTNPDGQPTKLNLGL